jgi:hypothetical protein
MERNHSAKRLRMHRNSFFSRPCLYLTAPVMKEVCFVTCVYCLSKFPGQHNLIIIFLLDILCPACGSFPGLTFIIILLLFVITKK